MSLDVSLTVTQPVEVYSSNITHNLGKMAVKAGIYKHLWRPEEAGVTLAYHLIQPLKDGVAKMKENPDYYRMYDSDNGWGTYDQFLPWVEEYLKACENHPDAEVEVSR